MSINVLYDFVSIAFSPSYPPELKKYFCAQLNRRNGMENIFDQGSCVLSSQSELTVPVIRGHTSPYVGNRAALSCMHL